MSEPEHRAASGLAWRAAAAGIVLAAAAANAVSVYATVIAAGGADHQTADWLISYPGQFVRRGLFGAIFLALTPPGQASLWILFAIQVALYVPLFGWLIARLIRFRFSWSAIALACSPLGLAFIGWDPAGGFRKEVLGFGALVLLAAGLRRAPGGLRTALIVASLAEWTLGVFSWEALAVLLPALCYLLLAHVRTLARWALASGYAVVAAVAAVASVIAHGDPQIAGSLCAAITDHGLSPNLCTGAITWMGKGLTDTWLLLGTYLPNFTGYLPILALALVPIALTPWLRRYWRWALVIAIAVLPLFALGIDWGRWIHILVFSLTVCIFESASEVIESRLWNPLSAMLYVTLWGSPHAFSPDPAFAYWPAKGMLVTVINWLQTLPWPR